jgi:mono/diheme cytochrome c family protein
MKCGYLVFIAAGFLASASVTYASEPVSPEAGAAVFDHWCLPCHGAGPHHPGTAALDAKYRGSVPGALQQRTDLDSGVIKAAVRGGAGNMAPFRKTEITDAELDALALYLSQSARHP